MLAETSADEYACAKMYMHMHECTVHSIVHSYVKPICIKVSHNSVLEALDLDRKSFST